MEGVVSRSFESADEVRTPAKTTVHVVNVAGTEVGRLTLQPGWSWAECIKPVVGTESCQAEHLGYAVSGRLHVKHQDGSEVDIEPGEAYLIAPGHDAWVIGEEPFVGVEFKSAATYARG